MTHPTIHMGFHRPRGKASPGSPPETRL